MAGVLAVSLQCQMHLHQHKPWTHSCQIWTNVSLSSLHRQCCNLGVCGYVRMRATHPDGARHAEALLQRPLHLTFLQSVACTEAHVHVTLGIPLRLHARSLCARVCVCAMHCPSVTCVCVCVSRTPTRFTLDGQRCVSPGPGALSECLDYIGQGTEWKYQVGCIRVATFVCAHRLMYRWMQVQRGLPRGHYKLGTLCNPRMHCLLVTTLLLGASTQRPNAAFVP